MNDGDAETIKVQPPRDLLPFVPESATSQHQSSITVTMSSRVRRDCPICSKKGLLRLDTHLRAVHGLDPNDVDEFASEIETEESEEGESVIDDTDEEDSDSEDDTEEEVEESEEGEEEDDPWADWADAVIHQYQEPMEDRVAELVDEKELPISNAQEIVYGEFLPAMNKCLQNMVVNFSNLNHRLKKDPTWKKIMETAKRAREDDDMDHEESVTHAVKRRKLLLDRVLEWRTPDWDEDSD